MINKFPWWKNLLIFLVIAVGFFYALPNLYGEDPAVQISGTHGLLVEAPVQEQIQNLLEEKNISGDYELENGQLLIRFATIEQQIAARDLISKALGDNYITALNLAPATPSWMRALGMHPLKLGLDLRGGVHFLMEIDMQEAMNKQKTQLVSDFRSELRNANLRLSGARVEGDAVVVAFREESVRNEALDLLKDRHPDFVFQDYARDGRFYLRAEMTQQRISAIRTSAVEQNINIIRNRVNELGVAEPLVQRQGADRVVVELPGIQDTARAKEILGATATLEFRLVDTNADLNAALQGRVPPGDELHYDRNNYPVVLEKRVILTGDHIIDASSSTDENGRPQVNISLDSRGGSIMSDFTKDNIGKSMATNFIEYKVLPAPIQIVEERTIGPSLGQQNIDSGVRAMLYGCGFLALFMLIYYKSFGFVANLGLFFNLVLIVGILSMVPGATMTLPGIAGIVLTLGMAVDANVLIYERIREELRAGRTVQQSIKLGYEKAFVTIADSNITSFFTAFILFMVGTGAVKGFALVLMVGLASTMFTAVTACRAVVNIVWGGRSDLKKLNI